MNIVVVLQVTAERDEGKFASREEIEELVLEEVTSADPSTLSTSDDATYSVTNWEPETYDPKEWEFIITAGTKALAEKKERAAARRAAKMTASTGTV